jgi:5-methylcytosine-specific restriction endonuclease McrA
MEDHQTLVLDPAYRPCDVVPWTRAITLWCEGKVEIVEEYDREVRSTYVVMKVPAVVRLVSMFRRDKKPVKFSRVNIYARDHYRCQYCGERKKLSELTYDHVTPRARGGRTEWTNIATACTTCNGRKACRTPEEAGMRLLKRPTQPTTAPAVMVRISRHSAPAAWREYLYWTGELEHD